MSFEDILADNTFKGEEIAQSRKDRMMKSMNGMACRFFHLHNHRSSSHQKNPKSSQALLKPLSANSTPALKVSTLTAPQSGNLTFGAWLFHHIRRRSNRRLRLRLRPRRRRTASCFRPRRRTASCFRLSCFRLFPSALALAFAS